jgi:hypothetical protein
MILAASSTSTSAWDEPGTLGFLVVFGMGLILFFVFRSLAKQLRKVREAAALEAQAEESRTAAAGQPADPGFADSLITGRPAAKDSQGPA